MRACVVYTNLPGKATNRVSGGKIRKGVCVEETQSIRSRSEGLESWLSSSGQSLFQRTSVFPAPIANSSKLKP